MATTAKKPAVMGYLPNDVPPFGQMVLLGFQHVLTMFPATVLCAILMKFPVSTVLTITGLGTVVALLGSKFAMGKYIPPVLRFVLLLHCGGDGNYASQGS